MTEPRTISDEELHAYIDGELDVTRVTPVSEAIARDPVLAARVAAFQSDKTLLQENFAPLLDRPVPEAWLEMIAKQDDPRERRHTVGVLRPLFGRRAPQVSRAALALAASIMLVVGGWTFYRGMDARSAEALVVEALAVHAGQQTATSATPLADASAALNAVLKLPLKTPDLSGLGYTLTAVEVHDGKGVKLDYRDANNRVFTLYLKASSGTPRFDMINRSGTRICIWQDDVLSTIMVGEMSAGEMLRLASMAYAGLS